MEGSILLLHKQEPTVILFKRSQYQQQIIISEKIKVSHIFYTNTQLLWHITEAYALDKLTVRITVRLGKVNFSS
jgi:hypothetical protein